MGLFDKAKEAFQNLFDNDDNRSALKDQQAVRKTVETGKKQTTANLTSAPKSSVAVTTAPKERGINTNKAQPKAFSGTATTPSQNRLENYKRSFGSPGSDDTFSTMKPVKTKFKAESLDDLEKTSGGIKWENINSRFLDKTVENTIKAANAKTEKVSRPVSTGLKGQGLMNTDSDGTRTPALNDDVQSAMNRFSDTLNRKTVTERDAKTVQVGKDGKAPKGLLPGDKVVTAPGTYTIKSVNPDGSYETDSTATVEKFGQTWNKPKNTWTTAKSFEKEGGTYDDASAPRTFTTKQADPFTRLGNAVKASFTDDSRAREYHENQSRILADAEKEFIGDSKSGDYTKNRGLMVRVGGIGMESEYTADEGLLSSATPMQKQIYNYMYNKHGKKSADEYFEALKSEVLNKQNAERTEKYIQKEVEENPVLSSVASVGANAVLPQMNFVKNTIQGVKNTLNIGEYKPVDGNDSLDLISRYGSEVRGAISGQLENPLLRIGYNGVMSIADMGAQSLLYGTAGKIVTSGEKAAKFVTLAMSTVSANEAILDTIERGGSQKQAFTNGIVNGALEYLSESPAVEGVFEIFGGARATKDIKGAVLQIARQMGVEAGGEAFANVSQTLADQILMGDKSSYSLYVKQLEGMGMSEEEAKKQATKDMYIAQTLEAALTGAFAGGVMGGGATVMGKTFEGNAILNPETGYAQDLADTALSLEDFDEKHAETAEKIKNGEKVGIIEAANLKGAIAIHHSEWVKNNSEYIYAYVDMDAPNRLARALGQYTGRDDSGFRNRAFTQKWIEKSAEVFQQIETYSLTNNEKIRDDIEQYLKISDALMYSNSLSDEAQATAVVRAMANGVINRNETSAAGNAPVGQEESVYEEIPQAEQEVSQAEELPVFEEPEIEEMPVSEESQIEKIQEEAQTAPRTIADYAVGKRQGSSITYHKSAEAVNASDTLERAKGNTEVAQLDYDLIKEGSDGITFTKTDDFDGKTEPKVAGRWIYKEDTDSLYKMIVPDGEIIVDKSEYVPSDYTGFDVQAQKERESKWKAKKGYDAIQLNNEDYFYSFFADVLEDEPVAEDVQQEKAYVLPDGFEIIEDEPVAEDVQQEKAYVLPDGFEIIEDEPVAEEIETADEDIGALPDDFWDNFEIIEDLDDEGSIKVDTSKLEKLNRVQQVMKAAYSDLYTNKTSQANMRSYIKEIYDVVMKTGEFDYIKTAELTLDIFEAPKTYKIGVDTRTEDEKHFYRDFAKYDFRIDEYTTKEIPDFEQLRRKHKNLTLRHGKNGRKSIDKFYYSAASDYPALVENMAGRGQGGYSGEAVIEGEQYLELLNTAIRLQNKIYTSIRMSTAHLGLDLELIAYGWTDLLYETMVKLNQEEVENEDTSETGTGRNSEESEIVQKNTGEAGSESDEEGSGNVERDGRGTEESEVIEETEETAEVSQEVSEVSQKVSEVSQEVPEEPAETETENAQDEKKTSNEEIIPFESGMKYEFEGNTFELREWEKGNQHRIYINPEGKRSNWGSINLKTREYVETRGQKEHFENPDDVLNTILSMWDKAQSEQKSDIIEEESTVTDGENTADEVSEETDAVVQNEEKNAETGVEQTQESEEKNVQRADNELSEGASAGVLPEDEGDRGTGRTDSGDGYDSVSGLEQTSESDGGTVASDGGIEESSGQGFGSQDDLASGGRSDTGTAEGNDSGQFTGGRFYLNPENDANNMGVKARLNANFKAIEILKAVRDADHVVNEEDKKVLAQYSGWGGLPVAQHTERLSEFLTEKEVNEIVRSSMTAYYTPGYVIKFAYDIAKRLGISKNAKILEQACGSGRFFGLMPKGLRESSSVTGVELDTVSGEIAKLIYSDIDVRVQNYNTFSEEGYNLIVGNVPFSNSTVYDNNYRKESQYSLHNYFILKGLKQLSPGGIMIVLTSSSTLDSAKGFIKDKKGKSVAGARLAMSQEANLIGAVRLPAKTFGQTDVVTDMLIFQKKGEGVNDKLAQNFLELEDFESYRGTIPVNEYFAQGYHDDMIAGYTDIGEDQFGKPKLVVSRKYDSNNEDLSEYLEKLPKNIYSKKIRENAERLAKEAEKKERGAVDADEKRSDGVMRVEKDGIYIYRNGKWFPYNPVKVVDGKTVEDTETIERIKGMYELLEEKKNLLELEKTSEDEKAVEKAIKRFSDMYDTFVKKYGYINDKKNRDAYGSEPNFGMLETLETVEKEGRNTKISKTDIFSKRVMKPYKPIESVDDVNDAMSASLAMHHDLDFDYMSELYGKSADEIVDELGDKVCYDPVEERYVLAEEYLSGNVREKLEKAEAVLVNNPDNELAAKSVNALRQIQPPELDEAQIKPELGAAWINEQYITDFANYICGVKNSSFVKPAVMYNRATSEWSVNSNGWTSIKKWSTSAIDGLELLEKILNRKAIQVKDKEGRILEKPTVEAKAKAEELKNEFSSWIFSNKDRKNALLNTYNRLFNNYVERQVAVEHIKSFPGQSSAVTLREHQIRAALKAVYQKSTLLVHSVGAGKTYAMIAGAQEMKRLGIANKPLMVVPNAKVTEFRDDYIKLYPNANILVIGDEDFTTKSMSKTLAMIEQGDYDCIIMRMSSFDRFPVSPQLIEEYKEKELERYRSVLSVLTDTKNTKEKKKVERAIESYEKKIDEMIAKTSEEAFDIEVFFDRCGIDALLVDEAHNYKNLFFPTRLDVAGISSKGITLKTTKLHIITELLHKRGNHVVFSTATPTTNSLAEFYTMMRYLQPDKLAEMGIESFDQWASVFGEIETKSELNITGQKYRTKTRFAKLKNIADLVRVLRQSFDFVNSEDLTLPIPAAKIRHIKVPSPSLLYHTNILIDKDSVFHFTDSSGKPIKATLANYTLAKMASLDMRLARKVLIDEGVISPAVTEDMLDFEDSKINTCVKNVFKTYEDTKKNKGTQIIFLDKGVPKKAGGDAEESDKRYDFDLYNDIKKKLVAKGMKESEIAFIHDYEKDVQKAQLSKKMDSGEIRVLIGSTQKAGTGINVQKRIAAMHHLDAPQRPADLIQRNGRGVRQGNLNDVVDVIYYSTLNSYDAPMWEMLERKSKGIEAVMKGDPNIREVDDSTLDDTFGNLSVAAANNPLLMELQDITEELQMLEAEKRNYQSAVLSNQWVLENYDSQKKTYEDRLDRATETKLKFDSTEAGHIKIGKETFEKPRDAGKALHDFVMSDKGNTVVSYRGLLVEAEKSAGDKDSFEVRITGAPWYNGRIHVSRVNKEGVKVKESNFFIAPTNIFSKIDDVLESSFKVKKKEYEEYLSNLEVEYKSAQEGIKEFSKDEELEDLRIRKGLITKTLQDSQEESSVVYDETKLANLDFSERIPLKEGEKTDEIISLTDEGKGRRAWRDGNENELAPSQKAANKARRIEFEKAKKDFEKSKAEADPKEPKPKKTKSKSKKDSDIHMSYGSFAPASGTISKGTPNRSSVLQGSSADIRVSENHGKTDEALSRITAKDREQAKNLGVIISGMVKRFKVPLIEKRYRKRPNALGWFDGKHKQITVKQKEQLSTVIHELGHKLDMDYSFNSNDDVMRMLDYVPGLKTRLNSVGYKATEMPFETMAHFIWCYLIEPDAAYEMGSYAKNENFYDYFERAVDGETLKNLQQTRRLIMAYFSKDVKERVSGQIRTREEVRKERSSPFRERWAEVQRLFIDHTYGAGQAMKGIRKLKGGKLTSEEDLQIALEFAGSSASVTDAIVRRGLVGRDGFIISDANLADILDEVETEGRKQSGKKKDAVLKDFSTYLISKHSIDRENLGQVTMSKDATDGDNIKAYENIISELDAEYSTLFEQQAEKLYSWFDAVMKEWVVGGGLLEPEIYSRMREMYPHYVPMFRVMDMTGGKVGNKKSLNPIKRASKDGSTRQIYDPIENLMLQVNNIIASCKRNQLGRVIDNLWNDKDENVRAEIASFVASIEPNLKVNKVHTAGLKQKLQNELFMREYNSWEPERKVEFDKLSDKDKILQMAEYGESDIINTVISDILLEFQATGNGMGDDVIAFRQGNSTKYYQILDPVLANALKGAEPTPGYVRMIGKVTRAFTSVTTSRNPFFAVSNMVRDFQHGYVMIDAEKWYQNFTYPAEYIKALVEALAGEFAPNRASNMYVEYAATRGFDAKYMYGSDTLGNVMREIRGARNPIVAGISLIDKLNGAIESAPRYLAYKRKLYATGDVTVAGKAAREATVNFLRPGAVTKSFNQIFPFLNAAIAGIAQANKLIFSPETYTTKKGLEKLARALVGQTIPALVLTLLAAGQLDGDDEKKKEFDELGEYMKNGYWVFRIGDTWLRLPKDREVSAVFATLPMQIAMSFVYPDRDRAVTSELLKYIAENFIPQISPLGWAIVQTKNNKTWYGGQITSYADEKLLGSPKTYTEVKDNTTSRIAIWASEIVAKGPEEVRKWLGVLATPKGIDYALDQLTGVIGDIVLPATTPAEGLQGVPASLKAKYTMNTAKSSRYTTEAYDIKAELDALEAAELATPEQIAWRDAFYRTLSKNSSDNEEIEYITAGDYYALIRQYRDDSSLSAEEKAEKMNDAYRHIADMTRELVYAYKNGETPEYSYGELQFPQSAADAGFTEEQYADALSRIRKANDKEYTKYQIVSGSYTAEQKEYLSDRFAGMSYENYGPKYEEMISAGITADDVNTAVELGKNYSSDKAKMLAVVSSGMPNSSVLALAVSGSVKYNDTMRRIYISAASLGVTPEEIDSIGSRADEISKELGKKSRTKEGTRKAIAEAGLSGAKATSVMTIFYPPR